MDKNANMRIPTASMSKIMTMAVVFDAIQKGQLRLTDTLSVSEKAWRMEGSKMFVGVGESVPVEDLIKGVIVQSGNDACVVLAESIAGSEDKFAGLMNEKAASYGMKGSNFMNASGMPDPNHYSTPRDLGILAWHIISDFPQDYKYYSIPEFTWNNITQQNRNPLIGRVQGADGMKTGHTEEAGYGLIGSAVRDGRRVIMVLSGMSSIAERQAEGVRIMEWALNSFKLAKLVKKNQEVATAPVVYGQADTLKLVAANDVNATVPATITKADVTVKARYMSPLVAPIKAGQKVGTIVISGAGLTTQEYPLVAANDVAPKGFFAMTFAKMVQAAKNK
jgi:D-alanyl-D-alanine carboxypeptidase (penicillin-binding protein 5/6)